MWNVRTLKYAAQRSCAASILRGFQELSGQNPEKADLTPELTLLLVGG